MTSPIGEYGPSVIVERLRAVIEQDLSASEAGRLPVHLDLLHDQIAGRFRFRLRTEVWGQRLVPETTKHYAEWHEVRWATWWDHLKDTYQQRWWMRPIVRRRPVRYIDIPHTRVITLTVESYRKFPEANFRVRDEFGPVVYQQDLWTEEMWHPW